MPGTVPESLSTWAQSGPGRSLLVGQLEKFQKYWALTGQSTHPTFYSSYCSSLTLCFFRTFKGKDSEVRLPTFVPSNTVPSHMPMFGSSLTGCMTLGKLFRLPGPQFPYLWNEIAPTLWSYWKNEMRSSMENRVVSGRQHGTNLRCNNLWWSNDGEWGTYLVVQW